MGDLISRRAAIVALDNRMSSLEKVDMQIAMEFAKGIIHELPSVTSELKWIPVSEMLPEKNGQYLVTTTSVVGTPLIIIRSFAKNLKKVDPYDFVDAKGCGWYDYDSEFGYWQDTGVLAWMELPKPYKAESEG